MFCVKHGANEDLFHLVPGCISIEIDADTAGVGAFGHSLDLFNTESTYKWSVPINGLISKLLSPGPGL